MTEYWLGVAWAASGDAEEVRQHWERAARMHGDSLEMHLQPVPEMTYWSALSLLRLGRAPEAHKLCREILDFAHALDRETPGFDYFALWIASFLLTYTFPALNALLGTAGVFFGYGAVCLLGSVLVWRFVPETRGRSLEPDRGRLFTLSRPVLAGPIGRSRGRGLAFRRAPGWNGIQD